MDQGEDFLNKDKSADKRSDSTVEMSHVLGSLGAANILASKGLRLVFTTASISVATASTYISLVVATASGSFPTAANFTTASVASPTTRVTRSSRGVVIGSSSPIYVNIPSISKKDKGKGKMIESEHPIKEKRDSKIARIHVEKELEMMIAELDRSNEMVAKYLSEYKQAAVGLSHNDKVDMINELLMYQSSSSLSNLLLIFVCMIVEMIRLSYGIKSQAGSKNRPPMLNKENYVPWSSRPFWYAKSRPNGKLIHNSIINGPYVRRMILELGDPNREVPMNETFHVQTDDELTKKELKQIEADDQAIQTILLVLNQDQPSFNQNYMQQPMPNPEDITDPTTAMNMALTLMDKAFKLNYSTPTNNNQRISSNPRNRQIAQPRMNMGQDRHMQMVGGYSTRSSKPKNPECWKSKWLIGVPGNVNQNSNRNGNPVAARVEGNATGHNGNQIRCYNCRGKEEAGIQLQAEEFDLMVVAADLDEIEEVNAKYILMANPQQASTSGTQTDKAPVYDSDGSAEYTELLKPVLEPHQVPHNDNIVISEDSSVEHNGGIVEQHPANVEET
nr:hypothetical protein [Tanacetum cinerariifolium]